MLSLRKATQGDLGGADSLPFLDRELLALKIRGSEGNDYINIIYY
jgi:hypothetical protein